MALMQNTGLKQSMSHPAELSNAGVCGLSKPLGFDSRLTEEKKYLVIIRVFTFWDPKGTDKLWFWWTYTKMNNVSYTGIFRNSHYQFPLYIQTTNKSENEFKPTLRHGQRNTYSTRTIEPAWVVLFGADRGAFPQASEDGEVPSH